MAALRNGCRTVFRMTKNTNASLRCIHAKNTGSAAGYRQLRPLLLGAAAVGGAYGAYKTFSERTKLAEFAAVPTVAASSPAVPACQDSVFSQTKKHALYLWINLKDTADPRACAKVVANLSSHVDVVCPPSMRDEDDEIWAGVGFGPNFYSRVGGRTKKSYNYPHRKGSLGELPSSTGDIFIHAKSDDYSKLFELCQRIMSQLPAGSVESFEDIYSFVYNGGRDLTGFIDGTENRADDEERHETAVEKETGGSYVITQKWVHKLDVIRNEKVSTRENWVGRSLVDSTEQRKKSISSHVARMTGGSGLQQKKEFEIVRQSMPYGNVHDKAGLFFIGYAESPENFEFMLDRMVGASADGHSDDIMRMTQCVKGTYFYFPGKAELKRLA